jgi:glutamyl endopeptidase
MSNAGRLPQFAILISVVFGIEVLGLHQAASFSESTDPGAPGGPLLVDSQTLVRKAASSNNENVKPSQINKFDYSTQIVPRSQLHTNKAPAETGHVSLDTQLQRAKTISITPDGTEGTTDVAPEMVTHTLEVLRQIEKERESPKPNAAERVAIDSAGETTNNDVYAWNPDTRQRIVNTTMYPWRAFGFVGFETGGCSGTLIGVHHVLTSGHCVYNIERDQWYKNVKFFPGENGGVSPYGGIGWRRLLSVTGWTQNHDEDSDFGLVILDTDVGNSVGWLGVGYQDPMPHYTVNLVGYPGDKPNWTMWQAVCPIEEATDTLLKYRCGTAPGSSGSSVYVYMPDNQKRTVYGVNSYEYANGSGPNFGPRINALRYQIILNWLTQ